MNSESNKFSYYNIFDNKNKKEFDKEKCLKFCGLVLFLNICINAYNEGLLELENSKTDLEPDSETDFILIEPVD